MTMNYDYHIPVLLSQCIEGLNIKQDDTVVDVTFGAGGHSIEILKKLGVDGHLYAFDQDADALQNALEAPNFTLFHSNYRHIGDFLRLEGVTQVDAILADLGISSYQIDAPQRGFSFRFDADLDMRMNYSGGMTAYDVVNSYDESDLVRLFSEYGEVRNAKTLARGIVSERSVKPIKTTADFNQLLSRYSMGPESKYMAQVYQSIRIEVNDEMNALREFLESSVSLLKPGGRLVVMSYHSLEDRLVKNLIKWGNVDGVPIKDHYGNISRPFKAINKQIIVADAEEIKQNPRSRSAKLRLAVKTND